MPTMATVYPPEVKEAARALYRNGVGPTETLRRLKEKTAGLEASYTPSKGLVEKWRAEFKRQGDLAGMTVREEEIEQVENLIYRQGLALARDWMKRMTERQSKGNTEPNDVLTTDRYMKMIDGAKKRRYLLEKQPGPARSNAGKDLEEKGKPPSILQQLAEEFQRETGQTDPQNTEDRGERGNNGNTATPNPPATEPKTGKGTDPYMRERGPE